MKYDTKTCCKCNDIFHLIFSYIFQTLLITIYILEINNKGEVRVYKIILYLK